MFFWHNPLTMQVEEVRLRDHRLPYNRKRLPDETGKLWLMYRTTQGQWLRAEDLYHTEEQAAVAAELRMAPTVGDLAAVEQLGKEGFQQAATPINSSPVDMREQIVQHIFETTALSREACRQLVNTILDTAGKLSATGDNATLAAYEKLLKDLANPAGERTPYRDLLLSLPTGTERAVVDDMAARQKAGVKKYGTTVEGNPLTRRQWVQHAYEEALDLSIYLKKLTQGLDKLAAGQSPDQIFKNLSSTEIARHLMESLLKGGTEVTGINEFSFGSFRYYVEDTEVRMSKEPEDTLPKEVVETDNPPPFDWKATMDAYNAAVEGSKQRPYTVGYGPMPNRGDYVMRNRDRRWVAVKDRSTAQVICEHLMTVDDEANFIWQNPIEYKTDAE